jgi:hypothetical protein
MAVILERLVLVMMFYASVFANDDTTSDEDIEEVVGKWVIAPNMASCDTACGIYMLRQRPTYCSNQALYEMNDDVTAENIKDLHLYLGQGLQKAKVEKLLEDELSGTKLKKSLPIDDNGKGKAKAVPNYTPNAIFPSSPNKKFEDFDCCKRPSLKDKDLAYKKRLCYCVGDWWRERDDYPETICDVESSDDQQFKGDGDEESSTSLYAECEAAAEGSPSKHDDVCDSPCLRRNLEKAYETGVPLVVPFDNSGSSCEEGEPNCGEEGSIWYRVTKPPESADGECFSIKASSLNSPDIKFTLYEGSKKKVCKKDDAFGNLKQLTEPQSSLSCIDIKKNTWLQVTGEATCGEFEIAVSNSKHDENEKESTDDPTDQTSSTLFEVCAADAEDAPDSNINDDICDALPLRQNLEAAVEAAKPLTVYFDNSLSSCQDEEETCSDDGSVWFRIGSNVGGCDCWNIRTTSLNTPNIKYTLYEGKKNKVCRDGYTDWSKLAPYSDSVDEFECVSLKKYSWLQISGDASCGEFEITPSGGDSSSLF